MMTYIISGTSIVGATLDQASADIEGEAVLLNLKSGVYYGLNEIGARVWELIQAPTQVNQVRDALIEEYAVEPDCCEDDLMALLGDLAAEGLIEVKDGTAT